MKVFLTGVLLAGLLAGCSGDDDGDDEPSMTPAAVATSTPTLQATETPATATPTQSPAAETPVPTETAGPPPEPACGVPLLPEGDPRRAVLSELEGRLVFACEGQIWTSDPDGTDQVQLTQPVQIDWENVRLFRVPENDPPTAEERAQLTAQMNYAPRWLPDGRVVFASTRDLLMLSAEATAAGERRPFVYASELYVVSDNGSGQERLTEYNLTQDSYAGPYGETFDPSQCGAPNFCFAGLLTQRPVAVAHTQPIVVAQVTEVRFSECCGYLGFFDLAEDTPRLSHRGDFAGVENPGEVRQWSWSADDSRVLLTVGEVRFSPVPSDEPPEVRLYDGDDYELLPAFVEPGAVLSPDGTMVAYCEESDTGETAVLYVAGVDGGDPREVASDRYCNPDWSPDGRFLVDTDPGGRVVLIDIESGEVVPVALGSDPDWGR